MHYVNESDGNTHLHKIKIVLLINQCNNTWSKCTQIDGTIHSMEYTNKLQHDNDTLQHTII